MLLIGHCDLRLIPTCHNKPDKIIPIQIVKIRARKFDISLSSNVKMFWSSYSMFLLGQIPLCSTWFCHWSYQNVCLGKLFSQSEHFSQKVDVFIQQLANGSEGILTSNRATVCGSRLSHAMLCVHLSTGTADTGSTDETHGGEIALNT